MGSERKRIQINPEDQYNAGFRSVKGGEEQQRQRKREGPKLAQII